MRLTAPQIVALLAKRGTRVTEPQVIAARRTGNLAWEKDGRCVVSEEEDVVKWAEEGCPAGRVAERSRRVGAQVEADDMSDEERCAARLQTLEDDQVVALVMGLQGKCAALAVEVATTTTRAISAEKLALDREACVLELEAKLAASEARLRCEVRRIEAGFAETEAKLNAEVERIRRELDETLESVAGVLSGLGGDDGK